MVRSTVGARCLVALLATVLVAGCASQATPSPAASPSPMIPTAPVAPGATVPATTAPSAASSSGRADTLTIGWACTQTGPFEPCSLPGYRAAAVGGTAPTPWILPWDVVFDGLYRYDAAFAAVPNLTDGPCVPQGDGTVLRCRLVETTFHDGTPLTADDVAYSYRLFQRISAGWTGSLTDVRVVDPRTVDLVLGAPDPTFQTENMPAVQILPQHAVEAAYASWVTSTTGLTAADLTKLADTIDAETGADPPVCTRRLDDVSALLAKLQVRLYREDVTTGDAGAFDPCAWMAISSGFIRQAATALGSTGPDAVAAAFGCFSTSWHPIGTGPYRLVSEAVDRVHLEAWPGYHGGVAATRFLDFVPARADGSDLADGTIDILETALPPALPAAPGTEDVRVASRPGTGLNSLTFNTRPGRLFADVALRKALQLCIDLPRDVDVVTHGDGTPVYGPVPPGMWASDPDLPKPVRDTAAARALIEGAGWRPGADGVYAKDGVRLAARIVARGEMDYRVKMADLIGLQARDCGMDLATVAATWDDIATMLGTYPHDIPGTSTPFDLYIGGWGADFDPAILLGYFVSSAMSDATHPDGNNFGGFSDPVLDRLVAAAGSTYDVAERARLYREAQEELASQLPWLWLWAYQDNHVARAAVASVDGPIDLSAANWSWQPERMVVAEAAP